MIEYNVSAMAEALTHESAAEKARLRWEKAREVAREGTEWAIDQYTRELVYGDDEEPCDAEELERRISERQRQLFPKGGAQPYWWWAIIVGARALVAVRDPSHAGNAAAEFVGKATGMIQSGNTPHHTTEGVVLSISEGALERLQSILRAIKEPEQIEVIDVTPVALEPVEEEDDIDIPF